MASKRSLLGLDWSGLWLLSGLGVRVFVAWLTLVRLEVTHFLHLNDSNYCPLTTSLFHTGCTLLFTRIDVYTESCMYIHTLYSLPRHDHCSTFFFFYNSRLLLHTHKTIPTADMKKWRICYLPRVSTHPGEYMYMYIRVWKETPPPEPHPRKLCSVSNRSREIINK